MSEVFLFAIGYFLGTSIGSMKSHLKNPDRVLRWDPNVFAWRPMLEGTTVGEDEVVLFAYEMKKNKD
tara:strand:+ start:180 stop:380 length:201 start_codon:yes stop_codon:yes gene_type:complete